MSENPQITKELTDTLKAEHGEIVLLSLSLDDAGETDVIARRPSSLDYNQFKAEGMERDDRPEVARRAVENLAKRCIVWPGAEQLSTLTKRYPALLDTYGGELLTLAGAVKRASVAKL